MASIAGIVTFHVRLGMRRRLRRHFAVALAVTLGASIPASTPFSARPVLAADCTDGFRAMPVEAAAAGALPLGSSSLGGVPAWYVGRQAALPFVAQWQSTTWRKVATPWTTDGGLNGVSALTASAAWAVGFRRLHSPRAIAARWNGASWLAVDVPHPGGRAALLTDVTALGARKAFAVGTRLAGGRLLPAALKRTKRAWVNVSPPVGSGEEGGLTAVTRAPDGKMWAAGWVTERGRPRPWTGYFSGSTWSRTPIADTGAGLAFVTDILFRSATDGWAVGYRERDAGGYVPLVQRWDGVRWRADAVPWSVDDRVVLTTVAVDATGAVLVAGQRFTDAGPSAVIAVLRDGTWQLAAARSDPYPGSWSQDAAGMADGLFVVGRFGGSIQAFATCDDGTTDMASPTRTAGEWAAHDDHEMHARGPTWPRSSTDPVSANQLSGFAARDVTAEAGLAIDTRTYGSVVADFNGDTRPDLFLNRHGEAVPRLMLGGETGFTDANARFQFTDRHLCAAADATGDGQLDLFCPVGRRQGTAMGVHEFLVNVGTSGGTPAAAQFGLLDVTGRGRTSAFVRLGAGNLPGLFIGNEPVKIDGLPSFNRFYRNVEGERFEPAPEMGLDASVGAQCALAANIDADVDEELLVCTLEANGGAKAGLRVYDFDGQRFVDRTKAVGLSPSADVDVEVADFDADGAPDIAQLRATRLRVSLANGAAYETAYQLDTQRAVAIAVGDVNEDQRPDIFVARDGTDLMLVNDGRGTSFTNMTIPQSGGSADDVVALDYDANGLSDFLTLNGRFSAGPLKLIAFFRES